MRVFDLTHTICNNMPVYPGTEPPRFSAACTCAADGFRETKMEMLSHVGTHIDAPAHLYDGKTALDAFPADRFIGRALVVDCRHVGEGGRITMAELAPYGELVHQVDFLLFCTGWDEKWATPAYFGAYPVVDDEVFGLIMQENYKGIGFDHISLDPITDTALTYHHMLFAEKDIINIENLTNLHQLLGDAPVMFACLPIKLENADGCPARAVAWQEV